MSTNYLVAYTSFCAQPVGSLTLMSYCEKCEQFKLLSNNEYIADM